MYILISTDGTSTLEEQDDFKRFSIVNRSSEDDRVALDAIAIPAETNHYWVKAQSVIDLSEKGNQPDWVNSFWSMLNNVEPYGYADMKRKLVKAHVEPG